MSNNMSNESLKNIDDHERKQIQRTIDDLEMAADALRTYVAYSDHCASQGVRAGKDIGNEHTKPYQLRHEEGPAGPNSDIHEIRRITVRALRAVEKIIEERGMTVDKSQIKLEILRDKIASALNDACK